MGCDGQSATRRGEQGNKVLMEMAIPVDVDSLAVRRHFAAQIVSGRRHTTVILLN